MLGDAHFEKVAALLSFDGPDGSTSIIDSGPHSMDVQAFGGAQIKTDQSVFGGASLYLGGGAYLRSAHSELFQAASDFTCEMRIRPSSPGSLQYLATKRDTTTLREWSFYIEGGNVKLAVFSVVGAQHVALSSVSSISPNAWVKAAWEREGDTFRIIINDVVEAATTVAFTYGTNTDDLTIGRDPQAFTGRDFTGHIDEFRITKGLARSTFGLWAGPFPAYAGRISGSVQDAGGAASRVVRAYRRDTGALVAAATSDATTGNYSLNCPTLSECVVVCLDDASGVTYNDKIARAMPA